METKRYLPKKTEHLEKEIALPLDFLLIYQNVLIIVISTPTQ